MICPFCSAQAESLDICPSCGANLKPYRQILSLADYYYNEGLNRAMVRDLSGAIENLKLSLKYNKFQIDARNLLGLVYFETQQLAAALSEWVVSVNFMPEGNMATLYLEEFEIRPTLLSEADKGVRKYNLALEYCRSGSRDLAVIQLKKVKDMMPRFAPGFQLLALLYIQEGKYEQAKRLLKEALRIDTNNTTTLRYLKEVNEALAGNDKKRRRKKDSAFSYESGNETIIIPRSFEQISGLAGTMLNIFVGLGIGLLVMMFLIIPGIKQNANRSANEKLADMSVAASARAQSVSALRREIDDINSELDGYRKRADSADINEVLIRAYLAYDSGDADKAGRILSAVDTAALGDESLQLYEHLTASVNSVYLQNLYDEGVGLYDEGEYKEAGQRFSEIVGVDQYFAEGGALYYLGQSCRRLDKLPEAKIYFAKLVKAFPKTTFAQTAAKYVSELEIEQADINAYVDPDAHEEENEGNEAAEAEAAPAHNNQTNQQAAVQAANQAAIEEAVRRAIEAGAAD